MTASQLKVVRSLIVLAWADGRIAPGERGVIDGLLGLFGATEEQERELWQFASTPRRIEELGVEQLDHGERDLLIENALLLAQVDGRVDARERDILERLSQLIASTPLPS